MAESQNEELVPRVTEPDLQDDERPTARVILDENLDAFKLELVRTQPLFQGLVHANTATRMKNYLVALARLSYPGRAMRAAGIGWSCVSKWRKDFAEFRDLEKLAQDLYLETLERVADSRAIEGWEEPVFSHKTGNMIGSIRRYDHKLLELRLKALAPEKYAAHRKTELSGPGGGPVQVQPVISRLKEKLDGMRRGIMPLAEAPDEPK